MSDFPNDQDCDPTPDDAQLDRLLASTDAELLTAIGNAQAPALRPGAWALALTSQYGFDTRWQPTLPELGEYNGAVLTAEADLDLFVDLLRSITNSDTSSPWFRREHNEVVEYLAHVVVALKELLRSRALTRQAANRAFHSLYEGVALLGTDTEVDREGLAHVGLLLDQAKGSVLYLFNHADDFGDCPVPSHP